MRLGLILCLALLLLVAPGSGAAETPPDTLMWIEVYPDQDGQIRIFTMKSYREDLRFTRDIIHVPLEADSWDPQLRIEVDGPVTATYSRGNIEVLSTGAGRKSVKVWFTAYGLAGTGRWGERLFSEGWMVRPDFEELGTTKVLARAFFPPGVTPDRKSNGIHVGGDKAPSVTRTTVDGWEAEVNLEPGEHALLGVGYSVPSESVRQWMITASLSLSLTALVLAAWTALRQGPVV